MFYILLKNAISYVDWLVKRKQNHSLQFQWDNEVLQFVESLKYHGGRKVVNLLRGSGSVQFLVLTGQNGTVKMIK